jgi:hypothetical protein
MTDEQWLCQYVDYNDDDIEYFKERVGMILEEHTQPNADQIRFARNEARQQLWKKNGQRRIA